MKNNLIIKFDIDIDVKILLNNNIIGESGYKDSFKTTIEEEGLLTIKHGRKKANIRVLKEQINNIYVTYSTGGQLKATFIDNDSLDNDENNKEKENISKEIVNHNNIATSEKDFNSLGRTIGCLMYIIGAILFLGGIIVTLNGFYPAIFITVFSGIFFAIANAIGENIPKATLQKQINRMFEQGDIIGKKLNDIEDIIGKHSYVDISNNNNRIYRWDDCLEIICDKNNVCKEVLKRP